MPEISPIGFDATIRHATYLERLKAGQVRQITPMLRQIDEELRKRLSKGELTTFARARLERLLESVDKQLKGILDEFGFGLSKELTALAKLEATFEAASLNESIRNPHFEATVPAPAKVVAAAMASPLGIKGIHGGKLLKSFIKDWDKSQRDLLTGIIRNGSVTGQTNAEIIRAIRGDARLGFRNGALALTRNQTAAMTRTAVQHISHQARLATLQANSRVVKKYRWLSTLDDRTSEICQGLSGEEFEVGNGPIPPAHVNCRSTIVAVLEGEFAEELRKGRKQASQFGPVDAKENYFDWMKRQPAAFQDQALGPVKARLLRRGGLTGEEFRKLTRADNFRPLTLAEMAKLNPTAFEKAGIRITAGGRAIIEGSRIKTIQANLPPAPPRPKAAPPVSKKGSLTDPNSPAKRQEWTQEWRDKDTFKGPRLAPLADAVDDPGIYSTRPGMGAYYQPANQSIHLATHKATDHAGRAMLRHEWGHYLDDVLGRLAIQADAAGGYGPLIRKIAGKPIDSFTSRFISGWSKPVKALQSDAKKIKKLGARIYKQMFPESRSRTFTHSMIERAWADRKNQVLAMGREIPLTASRKELANSDSIVARVYRRLKNDGVSFSMADDVLWAEASAAGDLSILLANQGRTLWYTLKKFSPDGAGNFGKFSDLLGAITKTDVGDYSMGWGHGKTYYKNGGMHSQATESFANLTALEKLRRNDALWNDIVQAFAPDLTRWYDELIDELVGAL